MKNWGRVSEEGTCMRVAECGFSLSRAPALCHSDSRVGKVRAGLVKVKPVGLTHITNIPMIPTLRLTLAANICGGNNKIIPDLLGGNPFSLVWKDHFLLTNSPWTFQSHVFHCLAWLAWLPLWWSSISFSHSSKDDLILVDAHPNCRDRWTRM